MYEEGQAKIKYDGDAFLNPTARFSRDLAIAFVSTIADKNTRLLDPTSATGIRGIRYYLETKSKDVTLLEINKKAAAVAKRNLAFNKVKARLLNKSIQEFCNTTSERFDVIDLDPFGSPAPNLYDIMKVAKDGGYIFLTATDTAVLCGAHEKACIRIYDAKPMHDELCQEVGLRVLVGFAARVAAQFNYGVEVVLALNYAHYMRVMLRLKSGAATADASIKQLGYAYHCRACGERHTRNAQLSNLTKCERCSNQLTIGGKMWLGSLRDLQALKKIISVFEKRKFDEKGLNLLKLIKGELETPLYYPIPKLTKLMHLPSVRMDDLTAALRKKGFVVTRTHFDPYAIKSDADVEDIKRAIIPLSRNI